MQAPFSPLGPQPLLAVGPRVFPGTPAWQRWRFASHFYLWHLWVPLAIFTALSLLLMGLHGDQWLADRLYAMEGHAWALRSAFITEDLLHEGGRQASKYAWFALLLGVVASRFVGAMKPWQRPLLYLLVATLLSTAVVALLKQVTHMDCPWDVLRYGGTRDYYGLFTHRPSLLGHAKCFPAGHASAGYAWIALYFFFLSARPQLRWWGLACALTLGLAFGMAQQLRGAHFLSHDVWSLMICWWIALTFYVLILRGRAAVKA